MLKLRKYYKPFIGVFLIIIILLATQAICDLKLPDYMSKIVNNGIQSRGVEVETPDAISKNALDFISVFMDEQEKELVYDNYTKVNIGDNSYIKDYPLIETEEIYVLNKIEKEQLAKLNNIFAISTRTLLNVLTSIAESTGSRDDINLTEIDVNNFNFSTIYQLEPMISMLPIETLDNAKNDAKNSDSMSLSQIGKLFVQGYYLELGVDIASMQQNYIIVIGLQMLGLSLLGGLSAIFVGYLASRIGAGIARKLRKDLFAKVSSFSNEEFDKFSTASLITRTTNDITQIQNITVMGTRMLLYSPIIGLGAVFMMLNKGTSMAWTLAVGIIAILSLIIVVFKLVMPKIRITQKLADKLNLVSKENLTGIMVARAFRTQEYEEKRFDEVNTDTTKVSQFIGRTMSFMMPCMMLIMNLLSLLIVWVGADLISQSALQVGDMMAFMQYAMQVIMAFLMISMIFIMLPRASVSAERIADVLSTDSSIKDPKEAKGFDESKKGYIEFKNVSFAYLGASEKVLDNITFTAKPGKTTAFIGSTGSGKSTLINLIPRFFDVTEGELLVSGANVKDVTLYDLHNQIGYIPQKGNLLSGTIESNLKYGNPDSSDEFMEECSRVAQAYEFIEQKDEKYNSPISQGAKNVSGGQKQRLSIARALVKNAPIYIFDDSFSALDFKTDATLREALKKHTGGSTILIVAQRVNTIMDADQIIVLDNGKIVGIGTHEELLDNCNTYYEIASSQLGEEELRNGRKK